tara:strand:- start:3827 stop:3943 length:117 start_codon:yes stop_codon:yes gene_type:complete
VKESPAFDKEVEDYLVQYTEEGQDLSQDHMIDGYYSAY